MQRLTRERSSKAPVRHLSIHDLTFTFCKDMAYYQQEDRLEIQWSPPGLLGGVTVKRRVAGKWYEWRVPANGVVNQAMAADLLGVTRMSINNWVRAGKLKHLKIPGQPSAIPFAEIKRVKGLLQKQRRLRTPPGVRAEHP